MSDNDGFNNVTVVSTQDLRLLTQYKDKWYTLLGDICDIVVCEAGARAEDDPFYLNMEDLKRWMDGVFMDVESAQVYSSKAFPNKERENDYNVLRHIIMNYGSASKFKTEFLNGAIGNVIMPKIKSTRIRLVSNLNGKPSKSTENSEPYI